MASFKVVIVGGSVAGLTLANILERYNIDYIVLEKHSEIAPQLGASLGVFAHGARILDQLGVYSKIEGIMMPVNESQSFGPDGLALAPPEPFGDMMDEMLGYRVRFLDRQELLQALFENLHNKSKVHPASEVLKIEDLDGKVRVALKDGSIVHGDILVGADGVHSRMRGEMWRIAESETPGYNSAKVSQTITCTYKCIFGIAERPEGIADGASFKCFHKGRSYLLSTGTTYGSIPRYTSDDAKTLAAEYAGDPLFLGLTFGDIFERHMNCVLVPLEEYVLDKCFHKRAILIGDSFHKMNPLGGQGGNSAMESAAVLGDLLKRILEENLQLRNDTIERIFTEFQKERRPRATLLMEMSKNMQQMEALDNPFKNFLQLKVASRAGVEYIAPLVAASCTPAKTLQYLRKEIRHGTVALDEEVKMNAEARPTVMTVVLWSSSMLFIALLNWYLRRLDLDLLTNHNEHGAGQFYIFMLTIAINGIWVVESHRFGLFLGPLFSSIPFTTASTKFGWEVIMPIYFALYIIVSRERSFYYPLPRAINLSMAKSLPIGLLVAYMPVLRTFLPLINQTETQSSIHNDWTTLISHIGLPILLQIGSRIFKNPSAKLSVSQVHFQSRDLKYLTRFYCCLALLAATAHAIFMSQLFPRSIADISFLRLTTSRELVQLGCLSFVIMGWCLFTIWDMRRVSLTRTSLVGGFVIITTVVFLVGPAALLAGFWGWREHSLERGRRKL